MNTTTTKLSTVEENDAPGKQTRTPTLDERLSEELIIGLVGPVGSGCSAAAVELTKIMEVQYNYAVQYHKISNIIRSAAATVDAAAPSTTNRSESIGALQDIGDRLRQKFGNGYLGRKVICSIGDKRYDEGFEEAADGTGKHPKKIRIIHIIDSIKNPEEVKVLRKTYGEIFWLIGVTAPRDVRTRRLGTQEGIDDTKIDDIIDRDFKEEEPYGQNVRDAYFLSDLFIRNDQANRSNLIETLNRFVDILFGIPVHTPTKDESSMYAAYAEAAKSACLSRQVGAAIVSAEGELIGIGRNDVPKFGGGLYNEDDHNDDHRCYAWEGRECCNENKKSRLYDDIFNKLDEAGLLISGTSVSTVSRELKKTDLKSLIEYSRAVHAEMDAITFVARTNKHGLHGGTLYSTTYPCHSCARHIVASGIYKVLYIEPYPKSLAIDLHSDAVSTNESKFGTLVVFLQYTGIAPKNILKLFHSGLSRKDPMGKVINVEQKTAMPVVEVPLDDYTKHEEIIATEVLRDEEEAATGHTPTLV